MCSWTIFFLVVAVSVAFTWFVNRRRMKRALRTKDAKIPVCRDDCFQGYEDAIKVILPRLSTLVGNQPQSEVMKRLGFRGYEDMRSFYPAIAMIRLCHLTGYEVEFRNMRTEHSPVEEDEIVSRMTGDEIKKTFK